MSKLEKMGLLQSEAIRQSHRPDKKIYSVTPKGLNYLRQWILEPGAAPPTRDELLVKTFAGHLVDWPAFKALLEQQRGQHLERLAIYRRIQETYFSDPPTLPRHSRFQYATLRKGIRFEESWLAWCDEMMTLLQPVPP